MLLTSARSRLFLVIITVAILFATMRWPAIQQQSQALLQRISQLGAWAPVAFVLLYIVATVLFIPGFLLTLGAGVLFGVVRGAIIVLTGATLGACCAFLIARYFARERLTQRFSQDHRFRALDKAIADEGWKVVGLLRLSPVVPFNLLNYALGLTRVSLRDYFLASLIGMAPGTLIYVYAGALLGDLTKLSSDHHVKTPAEWSLYAVGLVATAIATLYLTRTARRALAERVESESSSRSTTERPT